MANLRYNAGMESFGNGKSLSRNEHPVAVAELGVGDGSEQDEILDFSLAEASPKAEVRIEQSSEEDAPASLEREETESLEMTREWYERACDRAKQILVERGYLYAVKVSCDEIKYDSGETTESYVLRFTHHSGDNNKSWTMEIGMTEEYIQEGLELAIDKIVLNKSGIELEEDNKKNEPEDLFGEQVFAKLEGKERDKSAKETGIIDRANKDINLLRMKCGLPEFTIPRRAIHVIAKGQWNHEASAVYVEELRAIAIKETPADIVFYKKVIHESLHANIDNTMLPKMLNEALVESVTVDMVNKNRDEDLMQDRSHTDTVMERHEDSLDYDGNVMFSEETYYAWVDEYGRLNAESFTYKPEREALQLLLKKVAERDGGQQFINEEAVREEMLKAVFSGEGDRLGFITKYFGADAVDKLSLARDPEQLMKVVAEL